jgi:hypothetical protein
MNSASNLNHFEIFSGASTNEPNQRANEHEPTEFVLLYTLLYIADGRAGQHQHVIVVVFVDLWL